MLNNIVSLNFDLDGNLLHLEAPAVLFHKETGEELLVEHSQYAKHYAELGKTVFPEYEVRRNREDPYNSSFRFTDALDQNHLLQQIQSAHKNRAHEMFASQYVRYYHALKNPRTRPWVRIVTARGTSPEHLQESQAHLVHLDLAPAAQLKAACVPVSFLHGRTAHLAAGQAKAEEHVLHLDEIAKQPITSKTFPIWDETGSARKSLHYFDFSDDSVHIMQAVRERLVVEKKNGRWPGVKVRLLYTGEPNEALLDRDVVITPQGELRETAPRESREIDRFIGISPFLSHKRFYEYLLAQKNSR